MRTVLARGVDVRRRLQPRPIDRVPNLVGARSLDLYDQFIASVRAASGQDVTYQRNGTVEIGFTVGEVEQLTRTRSSLT